MVIASPGALESISASSSVALSMAPGAGGGGAFRLAASGCDSRMERLRARAASMVSLAPAVSSDSGMARNEV